MYSNICKYILWLALFVLQHRVKQNNSTKERMKDSQSKGKKTSLANSRCWNISPCTGSIAAQISQSITTLLVQRSKESLKNALSPPTNANLAALLEN